MTNQLTTRRVAARCVPRGAVASALCISPPTARRPLPTGSHLRRGISLLEVLISMFVLLFGLMGVAAVFPVGNHYAAKGEQADRGTALAQAAMADLKTRGILSPQAWYYASHPVSEAQIVPPNNSPPQPPSPSPVLRPAPASDFNVPLIQTSATGPGYAFVIDPMGAAHGLYNAQGEFDPATSISTNLDYFPYASLIDASTPEGAPNTLMPTNWVQNASKPGLVGQRWPLRRVGLQQSTGYLLTPRVAETVFRLHDDVTNELPKQDDRPAIQRWSVDTGGYPLEEPWQHTLLARQYAGAFSWLATVVPTSVDSLAALQPLNSRFGSDLYEVSVAVFNKREAIPPSAATERLIEAQMLQGNELVINGTATPPEQAAENLDNAVKDIRAGNWIAVAGVHPTTGAFLLRWYRILSIDDENDLTTPAVPIRRLMLDGTDWPAPRTTAKPTGYPVEDLRAILLPGVISVTTQMLPMEAQ
jgi:hypothetical protein